MTTPTTSSSSPSLATALGVGALTPASQPIAIGQVRAVEFKTKGGEITIAMLVAAHRRSYGHDEWLITPAAGLGAMWAREGGPLLPHPNASSEAEEE